VPLYEILVIPVVYGLAIFLVWRSIKGLRQSPEGVDRLREMVWTLRDETRALRADLDEQRNQLTDALERLDFAERLLARGGENPPLPPNRNPKPGAT
jgi:hypothetical protein